MSFVLKSLAAFLVASACVYGAFANLTPEVHHPDNPPPPQPFNPNRALVAGPQDGWYWCAFAAADGQGVYGNIICHGLDNYLNAWVGPGGNTYASLQKWIRAGPFKNPGWQPAWGWPNANPGF